MLTLRSTDQVINLDAHRCHDLVHRQLVRVNQLHCDNATEALDHQKLSDIIKHRVVGVFDHACFFDDLLVE